MIIGILAAIAVPQYINSVEKGRFAEARIWLHALNGAQERHLARKNAYFFGGLGADPFDAVLNPLAHYTPGAIAAAGASWSITLTRSAPCPARYGCYVLTYSGDAKTITCGGNCLTELLP